MAHYQKHIDYYWAKINKLIAAAFFVLISLVCNGQTYQDHMKMIDNYGGRVVVVEDYTGYDQRLFNTLITPIRWPQRPYYGHLYRPVRWNAIYSYIPLKVPNLWKLEDYYNIGEMEEMK